MSLRYAASPPFAGLLTIILTIAVATATAADAGAAGLSVDHVKRGFAGDRAGIQVGDTLTGWSLVGDERGESVHPLANVFDLAELELERHPINPVALHIVRDGAALMIEIGAGQWRIGVKPDWEKEDDARFLGLVDRLPDLDEAETLEILTAYLESFIDAGRRLDGITALVRLAETLSDNGRWDYAGGAYQLGLHALEQRKAPRATAYLLNKLGWSFILQSRFDDAADAYAQAADVQKAIAPDRLGVAQNIVRQGTVAIYRGDFETAQAFLEDGLWRQKQRVPGSMLVASTLSELGRVTNQQGRFSEGEQFFREALAITERLLPGSREVVKPLNGVAITLQTQGDEVAAERAYQRALSIAVNVDPESRQVAVLLNNIGTVWEDRGDYRRAEHYFLRALVLHEQLEPQGPSVSLTLGNLGVVAMLQSDWASARDYHSRALALREASSPGSLDVAVSLSHLGKTARLQKAYDDADRYLHRALPIAQRVAPRSPVYVRILLNLGKLAIERQQTALANEYLGMALTTSIEIAPRGRDTAEAYLRKGDIALRAKRHEEADRSYSAALDILTAIAKDTFHEAEAHYGLARVQYRRGDIGDAKASFERAITALDAQHGVLGGTETTKAESRARYTRIYDDYVDLLLDEGDDTAAFKVLERSRAKVLKDLLHERTLDFAGDLPADLDREWRVQERTHERLRSRLFEATDAADIADLQQAIADSQSNLDRVRANIKQRAPNIGQLHDNEVTSLVQAQNLASGGVAVVSYDVGDEETHVFVLTEADALVVRTLPVGRTELQAGIARFRQLIDAGRWDRAPDAPLREVAQKLYEQLVQPLEPQLEDSSQLLIVPDGPLNVLPFAALVRSDDNGRPMYMAEWKPTQTTSSLTVYAQLGSARKSSNERLLVAFADPNNAGRGAPPPDGSRPAFGAARDDVLEALPWSRDEVKKIGTLYEDSLVFIGDEALESRAKSVPRQTGYLHIAAHALLNEHRPMETAIVLSAPKDGMSEINEGYLYAWEVLESVRINADLVTLSACETALGKDYAGEGLLGLTHAFQFAGASAVLASQWRVRDRSTAQLMAQFYANRKLGMSLAEALQSAQIAMIRGELSPTGDAGWLERLGAWFRGDEASYAHPYHWAGFVLNGAGF